MRSGTKEVDELVGVMGPLVAGANRLRASILPSTHTSSHTISVTHTPFSLARSILGNLMDFACNLMTGAHGTFSSKGLSMALNGLQGLSSKHIEVRVLVDALAGLMERSEATFEGFDDFHQIATALNGLQGR